MKVVKYALFAFLTLGFAGCLDVEEKIEIRKNGSGSLTMDMDMSQMLEMLQQYMGKEELQKKGISKMDTTINLRDILDSVQSISAEKKAVLAPGKVHIRLDMDAKLFTTHMYFPFSSQENLQKLYVALGDGSLGSAELFKSLGGAGGGGPSPDINQFNGIYDFTAHDGLISKRVNDEKLKKLQSDPQLAQIKQAGQMGVEINYTTTIALPRPVKKIDNALATLSADKKTVTIKFNLVNIFDHPEQFGYTISY